MTQLTVKKIVNDILQFQGLKGWEHPFKVFPYYVAHETMNVLRSICNPLPTPPGPIPVPPPATGKRPLKTLTVPQVVNLLNSAEVVLNTYSNLFLQKNINGRKLGMCSEKNLETIGITDELDRKYLLTLITEWNEQGVNPSLLLPN